jgi:MFS family permease
MRDAFDTAVVTAGEFLPKFLGFLAILIIGYFVAKVIANVVAKVLERVGFDRAVERGGIRKALAKSQYDPSDILAKVVFYALFLFVLTMAFGMFGDNPISQLLASVIAFLPKIFVAVVIVVVAAALATAARELVVATLGGLSYGALLGNLAAGAILMIGIVAALNQVEIAPEVVNGLYFTVLAIIAGSAIIAIGGGGIQPMRQRWEKTLTKYDEEKDNVRREIEATSAEDLKAHAQQRKEQLSSSGAGTPPAATIQLPQDEISPRS